MHISNFSKTEKNVVAKLDLIMIVSMVSKLCDSAGISILKSCKLQKISRRGVILARIAEMTPWISFRSHWRVLVKVIHLIRAVMSRRHSPIPKENNQSHIISFCDASPPLRRFGSVRGFSMTSMVWSNALP
jgi:hypothetical protein